MADSKDIQWITVNGRHIPLGAGETKEQAIKRVFDKEHAKSVANHNEDVKMRQIEQANAERERLNNKPSSKETATVKTQSEHKRAIRELGSDKYGSGTYDLETKKPTSFNDGYQVTFCQKGDNYSDEDYAKKVNECLKNSTDGKSYAGKFEGEPEVSFHWGDRKSAEEYARANNQKSIWDWAAMKKAEAYEKAHPEDEDGIAQMWAFCEIGTGGSGEREEEDERRKSK